MIGLELGKLFAMDKVELLARRRVVLEFIKADPVKIAFARKQGSTKTAAGGYVKSPDITLPPQRARIVQNRRRFNNGIINVEAGDIPHTDYLLLGTHKLNVEVDDTFVWLGENYRVTGRFTARTESTLCSIEILGKENRDANKHISDDN